MTAAPVRRLPAWIEPAWAAPSRVRALITTRTGGVSQGAYGLHGKLPGGLNLGAHVGDAAADVALNRSRLPIQPRWLAQVHGVAVAELDSLPAESEPIADAAFAPRAGVACAVLTADCMPVLLADRTGRVVGVAHAGWRGLVAGVIEALVASMRARVAGADLIAYLGPHIGQPEFEVGPEVRDAFLHADRDAGDAFRRGRQDRWHADLAVLARRRLARVEVFDVTGGDRCTVSEPEAFYSYRRDRVTGRFASMVWIAP